MKIKIFEEYLDSVEAGLPEKYEWQIEAILDYFFKDYNLGSAELLSYIVNDSEKGISLTIDFIINDFNAKYLMQISKFLEFVEPYCKYTFISDPDALGNDGRMGIQLDFLFENLEKLEKNIIKKLGIKYHPDIKTFNL